MENLKRLAWAADLEQRVKELEAEVERLRALNDVEYRLRTALDQKRTEAEAKLAKVVEALEEILAKSTAGQWFHVLSSKALAAAQEEPKL